MSQTENLRIADITELPSPNDLEQEMPQPLSATKSIEKSRSIIGNILAGKDERFLVIAGPCSIHDSKAAYEYAAKLAALQSKFKDRLYLVMRVYFEKPRTALGWRGLLTDPFLNGSYALEKGLRLARKILLEIIALNIPVASEVLDPIVPQYLAGLISWATIGARTSESQTHRNLASGLSMPVGFKNSPDGGLDAAVNAVQAAREAQHFMGIDTEGKISVLRTAGNSQGHIILRGGYRGPNYYEEYIEEAEFKLKKLGVDPAIIVDCSHANSRKNPVRQAKIARQVLDQIFYGHTSVKGIMLESNLEPGNQSIPENPKDLLYGISITDSCIGWPETVALMEEVDRRLLAANR